MNKDKNKKTVVTRFAPSPTGQMHIGGVRTALFAYLWARKNKGTFILRIEDTDKEREVPGSIAHIQEALSWLGIDWDYGPDKENPFGSAIQSERISIYKEYADKLVEKGLAYPDPYTPDEVEKFRAQAQAENRPFLYRNHRPEIFDKWDGKKSLRFKVPEIKRYKWNDAVRGDLEAGEEALDDFIILKGDGYPTYNFAHIVDDFIMGVTHIMRADEFISSTPRFLSLYDALDIPWPVFVTLPPILREDRTKKLGKRDGAKDVLEYRAEGFLPQAMINYLAFIGWNPGTEQEIFTKDELIKSFDIKKIQKGGGAFNEEKLLWLNHEWIKNMSAEEVYSHIRSGLQDFDKNIDVENDLVEKIAPIVVERISTWKEFGGMLSSGEFSYIFENPVCEKSNLVWKEDSVLDTANHIKICLDFFSKINQENWNVENIKKSIWDYATEKGRGAVLWPLRYALTGKDKSPDPFSVAHIIGKQKTIMRLTNAIAILEK